MNDSFLKGFIDEIVMNKSAEHAENMEIHSDASREGAAKKRLIQALEAKKDGAVVNKKPASPYSQTPEGK